MTLRLDFINASRLTILNNHGTPKNSNKLIDGHVEGFQDPVDWQNNLYTRGVKPFRGVLELKQNPYPCLVFANDDYWAVLRRAQEIIDTKDSLSVRTHIDARQTLRGQEDPSWRIPFGDDKTRIHPGRKRPGVFYSEYLPMVNIEYPEDMADPHEKDNLIGLNARSINRMIYAIDVLVGIPWVLLNRDPNDLIRTRHLLPASRFRILNVAQKGEFYDDDGWFGDQKEKRYYAKYLQLGMFPGAATFSPALMWFTNGLIREAMTVAEDNQLFGNLERIIEWPKARRIINTSDLTGAIEVWKKLKNFNLKNMVGWEDVWFDDSALDFFETLVLNGGWPSVGKTLNKNWCLSRKSIETHGNTLQAWETWTNNNLSRDSNPNVDLDDDDNYENFSIRDDVKNGSDSNLDGRENDIETAAKTLLKEDLK